jgi:type IV pilus assembly protein PilB
VAFHEELTEDPRLTCQHLHASSASVSADPDGGLTAPGSNAAPIGTPSARINPQSRLNPGAPPVDARRVIHDTVETTPRPTPNRRRIGDLFVERGIVDEMQLAQALDVQRRTGGRLGEILVDLGFISSLDAAGVLAARLGLEFVDLNVEPIDEIVARRIPEETARRYRAIPLADLGDTLRVAVADPTDVFALDDLQMITRMPVVPVVADPAQVLDWVNRIWTRPSMESRIDDAAELQDGDEPSGALLNEADDAPIVGLVDAIISQATGERASDIHLEPAGDRVRIRFRVDGVLHDASSAPRSVLRPMVSRLKIMGGCDIANSRLPQDGRFSISGGGRSVDIRLTTLPTAEGEAVVLRLLDKSQGLMALDALGLDAPDMARYREAYRASQGAILAAGPTGSGKTSTLYATLAELNDPGRAIVSVEDPIEYHMDGVKQIQVGRRGAITFAAALRAILRADPDIILIGEIRDSETALIAAEAALTGHLVLTTVHTLNAATVPVRLIEMGVEPYLVTSAVRCVAAQRLARRLCEQCSGWDAATDDERMAFDRIDPGHGIEQVRRALGCPACAGTGYRGRIAIYEIMLVEDSIRSLVASRAPAPQIEAAALATGTRTLERAALARVHDGIFGPEEMFRVLS